MHAVSAAFLDALTTSHQMVARVDAYYAGSLTVADLPISDGTVTVDRGSKVRRTLSLTISDPKYLPWTPTDPLAVYGQTLVVQRGIRFPDGTVELCPLGTFRVDAPTGDVDLGPVTLTGTTAESSIQDDAFLVPTSTAGMGGCVDAIRTLIQATIPGATVVNLTSDGRNPTVATAVWDAQSDRWDAVTQIATAMAAEVYVDATNRFVIADIPSTSATVAWDVAAGEGGVMIDPTRTMSRASVYNAVIVSGENTAAGTVASGSAYDTAPTSPTRWGGPFGRVPRFYSSSLLTTAAQCNAAALSMLTDATAPNVQTSLSTVPNSALEAGDVLRTVFLNGTKELYVTQAFTVPLTVDGAFPITLQGGKDDAS